MARIAFGEIYNGTVTLENGEVVVAANTPTAYGNQIVGTVRTSIDATLKVYQNPVVVSEVTHWLKVSELDLTASAVDGGGSGIVIDIAGPLGAKVTLTAAGAGTGYVDLYVKTGGV